MVRTIDRYIIREVVPPFLLSLLILTFLLVLPPVMEHLEKLLAKGVSWTTAARIIWTAVPQAAGLTIPMSLLVGLLVGLGRLSADREAVALLACGVSPYRLLRPVGLMGLVAAGRNPLRDAGVHPGREPDLPGAHIRGHLQADRAATSIPGSSFRIFQAGSSMRGTSPTRASRAGRTCWSPGPTRPPEPGRSTCRAAAEWSSTVPSARSTWCWRTATGTRSPRTARPIPSVSPERWSWP